MKKEITQKEIKRLIKTGAAVDITNAPTKTLNEIKHNEKDLKTMKNTPTKANTYQHAIVEHILKHKITNNCVWNTDIELKPKCTSQKSFYKKATYDMLKTDEYTKYTLFSYGSHALEIFVDHQNISNSYYNTTNYTGYSQTTLRHVKEFILQFYPVDIFKKVALTSSNIFKYAKNKI